jgi:hypothetical protein
MLDQAFKPSKNIQKDFSAKKFFFVCESPIFAAAYGKTDFCSL